MDASVTDDEKNAYVKISQSLGMSLVLPLQTNKLWKQKNDSTNNYKNTLWQK